MSHFANKSQPKPGDVSIEIQPVKFAFVSLQRTQRALVGMLMACAVLGMKVFHGTPGAPDKQHFLPIIFSTSLLAFAYTIRNAMVLPSLAELRRNPRDPIVLQHWSRNNLIVLSLCAAVGLVGFFMQLLGAPNSISLTLYAISLGYLWLLGPAKP